MWRSPCAVWTDLLIWFTCSGQLKTIDVYISKVKVLTYTIEKKILFRVITATLKIPARVTFSIMIIILNARTTDFQLVFICRIWFEIPDAWNFLFPYYIRIIGAVCGFKYLRLFLWYFDIKILFDTCVYSQVGLSILCKYFDSCCRSFIFGQQRVN